jgi:hypothetical protein
MMMARLAKLFSRERLLAVFLFVGVVGWLLGNEGREGIGRDEAQYFRAGERYWGWFEELGRNVAAGKPGASFGAADIDRYFSDNAPDHPVIMKVLYGFSWRAFHRCHCTGPTRGLHPIPVLGRHITLPLFPRESTAFRFPAMVMAGLLAVLVFRFTRQFTGASAAAAAAIMAVAQPHFFFHAGISCFDAPITTMAFAVMFAYWKSLSSARWGVALGLVWGVALGVKHNAWMMPAFLVAHYLWMRRADLRRWRVPAVPLGFVSMAVLGPLVFYLHWPWLWHHPFLRAVTYFRRHMEHEHYNFEYLGLNWNLPPTDWDLKLLRVTFPFVSTALTVPVTTLALALFGGLWMWHRRRAATFFSPSRTAEPGGEPAQADAGSWRRPGLGRDRAPGTLMALHVLGPMAAVAWPKTPIFGGVKHFMPAMPVLAVAAGIGLEAVFTLWREARATSGEARGPAWRQWGPSLMAVAVTVPAVAETQRAHPDGFSHYNMIAGGFAGGASLGMNRQFWASCAIGVLPWVNEHPERHAAMYWHDVLGDALAMYKRDGRLALTVGDTGFGEPGVARSRMGLLVHEKHWALYEKFIWDDYRTLTPVLVSTREGVPLVTAYLRPEGGSSP